MIQKICGGKGGGGGIAVQTASRPERHMALFVKHGKKSICKRIGVLLYLPCNPRFLRISIPPVPDRSVHLKCPWSIIVKTMAVTIPAVSCIVRQNRLRMISHYAFVDLISLLMQKSQNEHVEEPPVMRPRLPIGEFPDIGGDPVFFLSSVRIPDSLPALIQANYE